MRDAEHQSDRKALNKSLREQARRNRERDERLRKRFREASSLNGDRCETRGEFLEPAPPARASPLPNKTPPAQARASLQGAAPRR
jgi:hypothetical protein